MADLADNVQYERGGLWRRASALVLDLIVATLALQMVAVILYPLTNGRVQFTSGIALLYCDKLAAAPESASIPADFGATSITDCRQGLPGLPSSHLLRVSKTTISGSVTRTTQIVRLLDAEGKPIDVPTLDVLALPLLLALRWLFEGGGGSPGRRICRIRLAMRSDGSRPTRTALGHRYGALMLAFGPFLLWSLLHALLGPHQPVAAWTQFVTLVLCIPALICLLEASHAVIYHRDAWYDRVAGTSVLRLNQTRAVIPVAVAATSAPTSENDLSSLSSSRNYLARHWRGELPLPISYWVDGVIIGILSSIVIALLAQAINERGDTQPMFWMVSLIAIWVLTALITMWQVVGIWRTATRYKASGKSFWGGAAQTMAALGAAILLYHFLFFGTAQIAGIQEIISGDQHVGPHQFRVLADGQVLEFSGGITFGVAREMEGFLNAMQDLRTVRLHSNGGRIREAQKMADMIKARGLATFVAQECLSACTIVFLGGKQRSLLQSARLGFHQPSFRGMTAADRRGAIAMEEARLESFGLSEAFAKRANAAPPSSMWYPDKDELISEHVATQLIDSQQPISTVQKPDSPSPANETMADKSSSAPVTENTPPSYEVPPTAHSNLPAPTSRDSITAPASTVGAPGIGEATPPAAVTRFQTGFVKIPADMMKRLSSQKPPKPVTGISKTVSTPVAEGKTR